MGTAFGAGEPAPVGFWVRFVAMLIDLLVFLVVENVLVLTAELIWGGEIVDSTMFKATVMAFMFVFASVYCVALHALFGQTIGKMVVKVRVVGADGGSLSLGTSVLRYIGYFLSGATFLIGYVMAGLRHDRRALHDLVAGTRVMHVSVHAPMP